MLLALLTSISVTLTLALALILYNGYTSYSPNNLTLAQKLFLKAVKNNKKLNILDLNPNDTKSTLQLVKSNVKFEYISKNNLEKVLSENVSEVVERNSILRTVYGTVPLPDTHSLAYYKTTLGSGDLYYVYNCGLIQNYKQQTGSVVRVPLTTHFTSDPIVFEGEQSDINLILTYARLLGLYLAEQENSVLIKTLSIHNNTIKFYKESSHLYTTLQACLEFKKKGINNYYIILAENIKDLELDLRVELSKILKTFPSIEFKYVPDYQLVKLGVASILIEKDNKTEVKLLQKGNPLTSLIKCDNNTNHIHTLNEIGLLISNLKTTAICFTDSSEKINTH